MAGSPRPLEGAVVQCRAQSGLCWEEAVISYQSRAARYAVLEMRRAHASEARTKREPVKLVLDSLQGAITAVVRYHETKQGS